jgi:hypothetical protein
MSLPPSQNLRNVPERFEPQAAAEYKKPLADDPRSLALHIVNLTVDNPPLR